MLAIIGGTGLAQLDLLTDAQLEIVVTEYGDVQICKGTIAGQTVVFLPRHFSLGHFSLGHCSLGSSSLGQASLGAASSLASKNTAEHAEKTGNKIAPHKINYRANIKALALCGVTQVVAVNVVGGMHADMPAGSLVVPADIIDYTYGREQTFFDGIDARLQHIDFTAPFDADLRRRLLNALTQWHATLPAEASVNICDFGVYACTQGPRLETAAEIKRLINDGCDIVGMTAMPEASLARELGLDYAVLSLVVNPAAGLSDGPIAFSALELTLQQGIKHVQQVLAIFCTQEEVA